MPLIFCFLCYLTYSYLTQQFCCAFFYFVLFLTIFFTIPVESEIARLKLALAIATGCPITVANDATEVLTVVADETKIKMVKRNNVFTKFFAHYFSFFNLCNKMIFNFVDFIYCCYLLFFFIELLLII